MDCPEWVENKNVCHFVHNNSGSSIRLYDYDRVVGIDITLTAKMLPDGNCEIACILFSYMRALVFRIADEFIHKSRNTKEQNTKEKPNTTKAIIE